MKKIFFSIFLFSLIFTCQSQGKYVDSLKTLLTNSNKPIEKFSIRVKILERILVFQGGDVDSASCIQLLQIAQQLNNDSMLAISYNWIGTYFMSNKGDNIASLEYYFKAIPLAEKVKDKRRISSLYFDIALAYFNLQNNEAAAINTRKGNSNLPDKSSSMYDFMLVQYQTNMSQYHLLNNRPDSVLYYAQSLLETNRRLKSFLMEYDAMYLYASAYAQMGDTKMAEIYFRKANAISGPNDFTISTLKTKNNYTNFLLKYRRIPEAHIQAIQLFQLGNRIRNNDLKLSGAGFLRRVFEALHQTDSAYYYSRMEADINGLIFSQSNINKVQSLAFSEQLRIIESTAKVEQDKKDAIVSREKRKQRIIIWSVMLGLFLALVFAGFILRSLRVTRKQKRIIELKSKETELQKRIIEEKNKDITDSITYARRIQNAILPDKSLINRAIPSSFILYKPKDIVSGDFYFFHELEDSWLLAAADCTGHGIPGAFMSMVGSNILSQITNITINSRPSYILKNLNDELRTALHQRNEDSESKDGMDIGLVKFNYTTFKLQYAGANRPLWIIRQGLNIIEEIKATKKAIGGSTEDNQSFDSHEIQLEKGDTFYISTDGYADQFSGRDGKKLMTKKFKGILLEIQGKSMQEQEIHLDNFIENWKAGTEQVDDILVIGVQI